jgi:hypothetical protein
MSDRSSRDTSDGRITFQDSPDALDYCKAGTNHERPGVEVGGSPGCRSPKKGRRPAPSGKGSGRRLGPCLGGKGLG